MRIHFILAAMAIAFSAKGQVAKLEPSINRVGFDNYYPVLSGNSQFLLYRSSLSQERDQLFYTIMTSGGRWSKQELFNEVIDAPGVNTIGGFYLNFDATEIFFTSRRYGSMGGFDIWYSEKKGSTWSPPKNAGKPVNSSGHEGDPTLSADGKTLYFMRCEVMNEKAAQNCSIWMAKRKSNGYFEEPEKLPYPVNTGNEQNPIILADDVSLIFASSRPGGKGGLDLYLSRFEDDKWSEPKPMDFVNTEKDDHYVSIPVRGDIIYYSREDKGEESLFKAKIPEEFQPYKVLWLDSRVVTQDNAPTEALVQYAPSDQAWKFKPTDENGYFSLILKEGKLYDVAVVDRNGKYTFSSTMYDLQNAEESRRERKEFIITPITNQAIQPLNNISFLEHSSELAENSDKDLQRLIFLMQKNPQFNVEIKVTQLNYKEDTAMSDPDLTEMLTDTITHIEVIEKLDTVFHDYTAESLLRNPSIDSLLADTLTIQDIRRTDEVLDSLNGAIANVDEKPYDVIASTDTLTITKVKYTFHNDRSKKQAEAIANYLIAKGTPRDRIIFQGIRKEDNPEESGKDIKIEAIFFR